MYIHTFDPIEKINYAIAIPKELLTSDGCECPILRWAFDLLPGESVTINASIYVDKKDRPEYLVDSDKRIFHITSWVCEKDEPVSTASMNLWIVNPEKTP